MRRDFVTSRRKLNEWNLVQPRSRRKIEVKTLKKKPRRPCRQLFLFLLLIRRRLMFYIPSSLKRHKTLLYTIKASNLEFEAFSLLLFFSSRWFREEFVLPAVDIRESTVYLSFSIYVRTANNPNIIHVRPVFLYVVLLSLVLLPRQKHIIVKLLAYCRCFFL